MVLDSGRVKRIASIVLLSLISIVGCFWFFDKMVKGSALNWTFSQSAYIKALIELVVLYVMLTFTLAVPKRTWVKCIGAFFVLSVFAHMHSFILPLFAAVLYGCMILMTGRILCRSIAHNWQDDFSACVLLGMVGMLCIVCFCSILRIGTAEKLRVFNLAAFLAELLYLRKDICLKINSLLDNRLEERSLKNTLFWAMIAGAITGFAIQLGRANIAIDYDSAWYGLRSDTVLAPVGGIYDPVIMPGLVYSYPKGFESLSLAFNFTNTYSFVYAVNMLLAALILCVVYRIAVSVSNRNAAAFAVLCCSVTAGIMNMASTAKSDIAVLLVQLIAIWFAVLTVKNKDGSAACFAFAALALSLSFKNSSLVFSTILILLIVAFLVVYRIRVKAKDTMPAILAVVVTAMLWLRTLILTGLPVNFLSSFWLSLGFEFKFPYLYLGMGTNSVGEVLTTSLFWKRLARLIDFLLKPTSSELDHVIIAWGGMLFAVVWGWVVFQVLFHPRRTIKRICENPVYAFSVISLASVSAVSMGCVMILEKPDGNYFMLMYAMTFIHAVFELQFEDASFKKWYEIALVPLICCGIVMCAASHWSWQVGFTPINLGNKGYYDHFAEKEWKYEYVGMDQIVDHLNQEKELPRIIMFANDIPHILDIPAVSESFLDIAHWGNNSLVQNPEVFYQYCQTIDLDYLFVENAYLNGWDLASNTIAYLENEGYLETIIEQGDFALVRFLSH